MSVYIIDKCERFVSQRAGCGKAASPDSVRGVRPQGVRLLDPRVHKILSLLKDQEQIVQEKLVQLQKDSAHFFMGSDPEYLLNQQQCRELPLPLFINSSEMRL